MYFIKWSMLLWKYINVWQFQNHNIEKMASPPYLGIFFLSLEDWERSKNLHMGSKLLHLSDFLWPYIIWTKAWNSPFGADLSKLYQKLPTCLRHFSNSYLKIDFPKLQQGSKIMFVYSRRSHWDAKYVKTRMIF